MSDLNKTQKQGKRVSRTEMHRRTAAVLKEKYPALARYSARRSVMRIVYTVLWYLFWIVAYKLYTEYGRLFKNDPFSQAGGADYLRAVAAVFLIFAPFLFFRVYRIVTDLGYIGKVTEKSLTTKFELGLADHSSDDTYTAVVTVMDESGHTHRIEFVGDENVEKAQHFSRGDIAAHFRELKYPVNLTPPEGEKLCPKCGRIGYFGEEACVRCKKPLPALAPGDFGITDTENYLEDTVPKKKSVRLFIPAAIGFIISAAFDVYTDFIYNADMNSSATAFVIYGALVLFLAAFAASLLFSRIPGPLPVILCGMVCASSVIRAFTLGYGGRGYGRVGGFTGILTLAYAVGLLWMFAVVLLNSFEIAKKGSVLYSVKLRLDSLLWVPVAMIALYFSLDSSTIVRMIFFCIGWAALGAGYAAIGKERAAAEKNARAEADAGENEEAQTK